MRAKQKSPVSQMVTLEWDEKKNNSTVGYIYGVLFISTHECQSEVAKYYLE